MGSGDNKTSDLARCLRQWCNQPSYIQTKQRIKKKIPLCTEGNECEEHTCAMRFKKMKINDLTLRRHFHEGQ